MPLSRMQAAMTGKVKTPKAKPKPSKAYGSKK
jgi:hypothetical protein